MLKLSYNLLSINKITRESHCKVIFLPESVCFRTWAQGRRLRLSYIARNFTSLMMIPLVVVSLGLVYCLPILALLNMTLCCGIFGWITRTLLIWNICFPIYFLKLMSPYYLVMCVFGQNNIEFHFPHNHITLIHSDVCGPSKVTTSSGKWWFVTFIDDHNCLTWVYLIANKSEVSSIFQSIYHTIETQFHTKISIFEVIMIGNS